MGDVQITVRGEAQRRYPPERATIRGKVSLQHVERDSVQRRAVEVVEKLRSGLDERARGGAVTTWACDDVRVFPGRPHKRTKPRPLKHHARLAFQAEFVDFDALAEWVDSVATVDGIQLDGVDWDVDADHRLGYTSELRRAAVGDAVDKAKQYADAIGRTSVEPVHLADAGMLGDEPDGDDAAFWSLSSDGPQLRFRPQDVVVDAAVDAHFVAS